MYSASYGWCGSIRKRISVPSSAIAGLLRLQSAPGTVDSGKNDRISTVDRSIYRLLMCHVSWRLDRLSPHPKPAQAARKPTEKTHDVVVPALARSDWQELAVRNGSLQKIWLQKRTRNQGYTVQNGHLLVTHGIIALLNGLVRPYKWVTQGYNAYKWSYYTFNWSGLTLW